MLNNNNNNNNNVEGIIIAIPRNNIHLLCSIYDYEFELWLEFFEVDVQ